MVVGSVTGVVSLQQLSQLLRRRPLLADAALAAVLVATAPVFLHSPVPEGYREPGGWAMLLLLAQSVPLVWRRRAPRLVFAVAFSAAVISQLLGYFLVGFGALVALYTVASLPHRRQATVAMSATALVLVGVLAVSLVAGEQRLDPADALANLLILTVVWFMGANVHSRRERIRALEERAEMLERERLDHAQRAVSNERARIARELHDIVAHRMSVMVVQADAARHVLASQPEAVDEALMAITSVGREALDEMRRLLGVLRIDGSRGFGRVPQPSIAHLHSLVEQCRAAGMPVELRVEGEVRPLTPGVDVSAYRIVQEALTNTLRHAGEAQAIVELRFSDDALEVLVSDDGRGVIDDIDVTGVGNGIVGMRERVDLYGGDLHVGNEPGGGFTVRAHLPVEAARP